MADPTITLTVSDIPTVSAGTAKIEETPIALDAVELTVSTQPILSTATSLISEDLVTLKECYYFNVGLFTPLWYNLTSYKVKISYYIHSWTLKDVSTYVTNLSYYTYNHVIDNRLDIKVYRSISSNTTRKTIYNIEVRRGIKEVYKSVSS